MKSWSHGTEHFAWHVGFIVRGHLVTTLWNNWTEKPKILEAVLLSTLIWVISSLQWSALDVTETIQVLKSWSHGTEHFAWHVGFIVSGHLVTSLWNNWTEKPKILEANGFIVNWHLVTSLWNNWTEKSLKILEALLMTAILCERLWESSSILCSAKSTEEVLELEGVSWWVTVAVHLDFVFLKY